jgi:hypothetical protein
MYKRLAISSFALLVGVPFIALGDSLFAGIYDLRDILPIVTEYSSIVPIPKICCVSAAFFSMALNIEYGQRVMSQIDQMSRGQKYDADLLMGSPLTVAACGIVHPWKHVHRMWFIFWHGVALFPTSLVLLFYEYRQAASMFEGARYFEGADYGGDLVVACFVITLCHAVIVSAEIPKLREKYPYWLLLVPPLSKDTGDQSDWLDFDDSKQWRAEMRKRLSEVRSWLKD